MTKYKAGVDLTEAGIHVVGAVVRVSLTTSEEVLPF
jgi:hypothetical protein